MKQKRIKNRVSKISSKRSSLPPGITFQTDPKAQTFPWQQLPIELQWEVVHWLPLRTRLNLSRCQRYWRTNLFQLPDLWTRLDFSEHENPKETSTVNWKKSKTISQWKPFACYSLVKRLSPAVCQHISVLILDGVHQLEMTTLQAIIGPLCALKVLSLRYCQTELNIHILLNVLRSSPLKALKRLFIEQHGSSGALKSTDVQMVEKWTRERDIKLDVACCQQCNEQTIAKRLVPRCKRCKRKAWICWICRWPQTCQRCFYYTCTDCSTSLPLLHVHCGSKGTMNKGISKLKEPAQEKNSSRPIGKRNGSLSDQDGHQGTWSSPEKRPSNSIPVFCLVKERWCKDCTVKHQCRQCKRWICFSCQLGDKSAPDPMSPERIEYCKKCQSSFCSACHPEPFLYSHCRPCLQQLEDDDDSP